MEMTLNGYPIDQENRGWLREHSTDCDALPLFRAGDLPERCDPRRSELANQGWLQVENQGQIGSCQGQALTECAEFCYTVATGGIIQFSRMYAYLASQMESNIRGDSGSTLEGGTKAAAKGLCVESIAPYPSRYPGWGWVTDAMRDDAKKYRLKSLVQIKSAEHVRQFIGSGAGLCQIGISWGRSMEPNAAGCIRSFSPSNGGGHSVVFAGYVTDADIDVQSTAGWWALLKNSWGRRWGVGGYAYVDPRAIDQMLAHQWTSFYGRSEMETITPRPLPVDFTREPILG
jgi:hypothetical protein